MIDAINVKKMLIDRLWVTNINNAAFDTNFFKCLGITTATNKRNYLFTVDALGTPSNWYLLGGLAMILAGILAATQYR